MSLWFLRWTENAILLATETEISLAAEPPILFLLVYPAGGRPVPWPSTPRGPTRKMIVAPPILFGR